VAGNGAARRRLGSIRIPAIIAGEVQIHFHQGGNERKPRRADLLRTLQQGVEGTSMPSFGLLKEEELEALVSYVIHLSIRGQLEFQVMKEILMDDPDLAEPEGVSKRMDENMDASNDNSIPGWWKAADANVIVPEAPFPSKESERRRCSAAFRNSESRRERAVSSATPITAGRACCFMTNGERLAGQRI